MSGKSQHVPGEHGPAIIEGPATALSWLTILPVRGATAFDRVTGTRVMASVPFVGLVVGLLLAGLGWLAHLCGVPVLLAATLIVVSLELFNRFMHLDGLADVADGLGSYAPPDRAREILADPHAGLIGIASAVLVLLTLVASIASILSAGLAWLLVFIPWVGRLQGSVACHRRFSPMRPDGFGALMVGTVATTTVAAWWLAISVTGVAISVFAEVPSAGIFLPVSALGMVGVGVVLARHCSTRFGGLNGDTTGFVISVCTALMAAITALFFGA